MYVDDPEWKGPRCRMCNAPVKDHNMRAQALTAAAARELKREDDEDPVYPTYFCSSDCVIAKYIG